MRITIIAIIGILTMLISPNRLRIAQSASPVHSCRLPDNGIETTHTVAFFVSCVPKAQQCAQAAQSFTPPKDARVIKGFPGTFLRPWDGNGNANRCDPNGNADVPCWAASELYV